jgi:hypothetical protein
MLSNETIFAAWRPAYSERGIPLLPVASDETKKTLIKGNLDLDLAESREPISCSTCNHRLSNSVSEWVVRS